MKHGRHEKSDSMKKTDEENETSFRGVGDYKVSRADEQKRGTIGFVAASNGRKRQVFAFARHDKCVLVHAG